MISPEDLARRKAAASQPRRAEASDRPGVTATLERAFAKDPILDYFIRADAGRSRAVRQWFDFVVGRVGLPGGEVWIPDDASAVALWLKPPQQEMAFSLSDEISLAPMFLSVVGWQRLPRLFRLRKAMDAHHPKAAHWYLFFLGVEPAFQGQGLGSALLRANLAKIDAEGGAAYLEASREENRALYLRHGFEVTAEFRPEPSGPPVWAMWRPPQS